MGKAKSDRISSMKQVAADILQVYCSQEGYGSNLEAVSIKKEEKPNDEQYSNTPDRQKGKCQDAL